MKYYRVPRFIKIHKVEGDVKPESDWVEVNKDGSPLKESSNKKKSK
tara:strand:+ start:796 stop:933 length:138 start_codon:yes stop_codon:yes gene_type:complete